MSLLTQIESDLTDVFFSSDDFAQAATYTPSGGVAVSVNVIFDDEYTGTNLGTGEIDTAAPQVRVITGDVTGIKNGDTFIINSVTYYVISCQPDGTGVSVVQLSKRGLNNG